MVVVTPDGNGGALRPKAGRLRPQVGWCGATGDTGVRPAPASHPIKAEMGSLLPGCPPLLPRHHTRQVSLLPRHHTHQVSLLPRHHTRQVSLLPRHHTRQVSLLPRHNTRQVSLLPRHHTCQVSLLPRHTRQVSLLPGSSFSALILLSYSILHPAACLHPKLPPRLPWCGEVLRAG
jgi:hypothetical protein